MNRKILDTFLEKHSDTPKLIVVFGPTASGKTQMSIEIATYLHSEIISTDSRQLFRYMDVGTGKILQNQMQGIPHHMIDILNPDEVFSMGDFVKESEKIMQQLFQSGKIPILVGGTGLYIDSLIFERNAPNIAANQEIRKSFEGLSNQELYEKLLELDESYARELHPNNRPYIERALEIKLLTGKSKSQFRSEKICKYEILFLHPGYKFFEEKSISFSRQEENEILFTPEYRKWIYERINVRVDEMFASGLQKEIESLLQRGYSFESFALNSIGYREFKPYYLGECNLDQVREKIKQNSRNYAKRQLTWFKNYKKFL